MSVSRVTWHTVLVVLALEISWIDEAPVGQVPDVHTVMELAVCVEPVTIVKLQLKARVGEPDDDGSVRSARK